MDRLQAHKPPGSLDRSQIPGQDLHLFPAEPPRANAGLHRVALEPVVRERPRGPRRVQQRCRPDRVMGLAEEGPSEMIFDANSELLSLWARSALEHPHETLARTNTVLRVPSASLRFGLNSFMS